MITINNYNQYVSNKKFFKRENQNLIKHANLNNFDSFKKTDNNTSFKSLAGLTEEAGSKIARGIPDKFVQKRILPNIPEDNFITYSKDSAGGDQVILTDHRGEITAISRDQYNILMNK